MKVSGYMHAISNSATALVLEIFCFQCVILWWPKSGWVMEMAGAGSDGWCDRGDANWPNWLSQDLPIRARMKLCAEEGGGGGRGAPKARLPDTADGRLHKPSEAILGPLLPVNSASGVNGFIILEGKASCTKLDKDIIDCLIHPIWCKSLPYL